MTVMGQHVVIIDNYDSFVYNLVQELGELGANPQVFRNDQITVAELASVNPDVIVISPGPGRPADAGISMEVIRDLGERFPVFGVCLGHQAIGEVFGGKVVAAPTLMHGKVSDMHHEGKGVFVGLPTPFSATRYHSLVIEPESVPEVLEVTATTADGIIMGLRHKEFLIEGVQFHPESILSPMGPRLLQNFLDLAAAKALR